MPRKFIRATATKDRIAAIIEKAIPAAERIQLAAELARGITKESTNAKGETTIYVTAPSMEALRFLEEYATGKPVQKQEVKINDGLSCIIVPAMAQAPNVAAIKQMQKAGK